MKVIIYPAVTLDAFIADLNGECCSWISDEDEAFYEAAIEKAGCSLVGIKKYEQYISDFPSKNGSTTLFTQLQMTNKTIITRIRRIFV